MSDERREEDLTAYALGELNGESRATVEAMLAGSADARREVEEIRATAGRLRAAFASVPHQALNSSSARPWRRRPRAA
jgi:anti-sigma factor RsiW